MKCLVIVGLLALSLAACNPNDRTDRTVGGAAIGAGAGALVGGLVTGRPGGALAGAAIGGVGGAIVGNATAPNCRSYVYQGRTYRDC